MTKLILALLIAATVLLGGCATVQTTHAGAVGVERKQFMLLSQKQAEAMATQSYLQTLKRARANNVLNTNPAEVQRVRTIANRLIAQSDVFRPDALSWAWEVNVEKNDEINAYCSPGGKIMVYTGLIEKLKPTDDELAAVIGHEIAHALREHGRERMSLAYAQQAGVLGVALLAAILADDDRVTQDSMAVAAAVSTVALTLPNSREAEREADRIGLELSARAGYDPNAAVTLWQKMLANDRGKLPEWLSTHPSEASRIQDIQAMVPRVIPLYEEAKVKNRQGL